MKHPKLKIKKRAIKVGIRRLKGLIKDTIHAGLQDIEPYLVSDIIQLLKKEDIIYVKKNTKKNKKKKAKSKK